MIDQRDGRKVDELEDVNMMNIDSEVQWQDREGMLEMMQVECMCLYDKGPSWMLEVWELWRWR